MARGPASVSPEDGLLDVTIVAASTLREVVVAGFQLLRTTLQGESAAHDGIGYFSAPSLTITTRPPQPILIDGEPCGEGQLHVECIPKAIRVLVPRTAAIDPPVDEPAGRRTRQLEGLPDIEHESQDPPSSPASG